MADVIHVQHGFSPWQPSVDSTLAKEYQYYEVPLIGIVEQHGVRFLFWCIDGGDRPVNAWAYWRIDPEQEAALDRATSDAFLSAITLDGPGVLALAIESVGIIASEIVDEPSPAELRRGLDDLTGELDGWVELARSLEADHASA